MIRLKDKPDINTPEYFDKAWQERQVSYGDERFAVMREPIQNGDKVLEIGCGMSFFLPDLHNHFTDIQATGLDYSIYAIQEMQKKFPEVNWLFGKCEDLGFPDNHFDVVILAELLEHLEDYEKAITEAGRVLKSDGRMFISIPDGRLGGEESPEHINCFSAKDIFDILSRFGKDPVIKRVQGWFVGYNQNLNAKMLSPVVIEMDDMCDEAISKLPLLMKWKEKVPNLRITLFTIPALLALEIKDKMESEGWIELVPHGWKHEKLECENWTKDIAIRYLNLIESMGYSKVFRAPQWQTSPGLYQAINELGWVLCDHKKNRGKRPTGLRVWEIQDREMKDVLHGHISDMMPNSLLYNADRYTNMTKDCKEFLFVSEDIEKQGI